MVAEVGKAEATADAAADLLPKPTKDAIIGVKHTYEVVDSLGKGAFGAVFKVKRVEDGLHLAMKCEAASNKKQILKQEARVLLATMSISSPHLLRIEDRGQVRGKFRFIVIRLAGKNLWELRMQQKDKRFTICTGLKLAEQCLAGIRDLHRAGWLHRDIKPPNFAIGREDEQTQHTVFILDFGLCRRYRTLEKDIRHPRITAAFRGTTRYASMNCLELKEQSRKDDIESWWYMVVEWTVGHIPWKGCKGSERKQVLEYKQQLRKGDNLKKMAQFCAPKFMPDILIYLDTLDYKAIPDYDYVYHLIAAAQKMYKCPKPNCSPLDAPEWDLTSKEWKGPTYQEDVDYSMKAVLKKE